MTKYNLFLDDTRVPSDAGNYMHWSLRALYRQAEWVVVRNYQEFVDYITNNGIPTRISFDHDLADEHYEMGGKGYDDFKEKTGYHCAQWFIEHIKGKEEEFPQIHIHSMNPVGAERIHQLFQDLKNEKHENNKEEEELSSDSSST